MTWRDDLSPSQRRDNDLLPEAQLPRELRRARNGGEPARALAKAAARLADRTLAIEIAREALDRACAAADAYQVVRMAAFPLRVLCARQSPDRLKAIDDLLARLQAEEPNSLSRAAALQWLLPAVWFDVAARERVLQPLLADCAATWSWRRPLILSRVAALMARDDPARAETIIALMDNGVPRPAARLHTRRYIAEARAAIARHATQ